MSKFSQSSPIIKVIVEQQQDVNNHRFGMVNQWNQRSPIMNNGGGVVGGIMRMDQQFDEVTTLNLLERVLDQVEMAVREVAFHNGVVSDGRGFRQAIDLALTNTDQGLRLVHDLIQAVRNWNKNGASWPMVDPREHHLMVLASIKQKLQDVLRQQANTTNTPQIVAIKEWVGELTREAKQIINNLKGMMMNQRHYHHQQPPNVFMNQVGYPHNQVNSPSLFQNDQQRSMWGQQTTNPFPFPAYPNRF